MPSTPHPAALGATRFCAAPVRRLLDERIALTGASLPELAAVLSVPVRTLHRTLHAETLSWFVADRWAVALGYHPCQLWPDWFADPAAAAPPAIAV